MELNLTATECRQAIADCSDKVSLAPLKANLQAMLPGLEEAEARELAKENFAKLVGKGRIPPIADWPANVYNVYLARGIVDDTTKPLEAVEVDGVKEMRYPQILAIVPTVNKAMVVTGKGKVDNGEAKATSRGIAVHHKSGVLIGYFANGEAACQALGFDTSGNSANRVLRDGCANNPHHFAVEPYGGMDFTDPATTKANLAKATGR